MPAEGGVCTRRDKESESGIQSRERPSISRESIRKVSWEVPGPKMRVQKRSKNPRGGAQARLELCDKKARGRGGRSLQRRGSDAGSDMAQTAVNRYGNGAVEDEREMGTFRNKRLLLRGRGEGPLARRKREVAIPQKNLGPGRQGGN